MEIEDKRSHLARGMIRAIAALGLVLGVTGLCATTSLAGDVSTTPANTLSVTNTVANVMPQASAESGWLSGLHVSGFLSQTFGMWQNPTTLKDYTTSRNNLATSRTWLQVDENYRLNDNNTFFMREWFVYEPPYSFNSANNAAYGAGSCAGGGCASFGHFMNDFYNQYTVRDAWWQNKWGPLTTYVGNQIVVWGQSIAFRVGDVVNPQDTTWAFGFANLEQSRVPQWMIHPILNLPEFGPFTSNFVEGILVPRYQPQWSWDYADGRYFNESGVAGSVNQGFPAAMHGPSARFDAHYVSGYSRGRTATTTGSILGPFTEPGKGGLVGAPIDNEFFYCTNLGSATQPLNPIPAGLQRACAHQTDNTVKFGPVGSGAAVDIGQWKIPAATVANWEEGVRFHTLVGNTEMTAFYFNTFEDYPNIFWQQYTNQFRFKYMPVQFIGVTADRPLPMPASLAEFFPAVGRAEVVYANHQGYTDFNFVDNPSGTRFSDTLDGMVAIDLDQAYAPWLTKTGNLSANIEAQDYIVLDYNKSMLWGGSPWGGVGGTIVQSANKNEVNVLFNIGTSWMWEDVAPTWTMIYNPNGQTFLMFPSLVLNPPWTKKYFVKLQAVEVLGGNNNEGGGLLKGQSLLTAQFQYNFNLL
ncbi:MAG: hypothetical protein ACREQX_12635 [Candidatus Binataceae bacterium]